jgi:small subunit ribosomal protein S9
VSDLAKKKLPKVVNTSGKRKTAIARATVKAASSDGRVRVNGKPIHIMEPALARRKALEPLRIAEGMPSGNRLVKVDISIDVKGGGQMGQVDAIRTQLPEVS